MYTEDVLLVKSHAFGCGMCSHGGLRAAAQTPSEAEEAGTLALGGLLRHILRLALGRLGEHCLAPLLAHLVRGRG